MARPTSKGLGQLSTKRIVVDKANSTVVVAAAVAAAVVVFSIFASLELINKISYQNKVINEREKAADVLRSNVDSVDVLKASYIAFEEAPESVIGTDDKNSTIVLDSLPSKYDFPAFVTSLESVIKGAGLTVNSISGQDDELNAQASAINPLPIEIPFDVGGSGNYTDVQTLIKDFERSIRPFKISTLKISGEDSDLTVDIKGMSYYQPAKELGVTEQTVKSDEDFKLDQSNAAANTGAQ